MVWSSKARLFLCRLLIAGGHKTRHFRNTYITPSSMTSSSTWDMQACFNSLEGLRLLTLGTHLLHLSRLFLPAEAADRNRRCFCPKNSMVKAWQCPGARCRANPCWMNIVEQTEWMRIIPGSLDHNLTKTMATNGNPSADNSVVLRATNQQNLVSFTPHPKHPWISWKILGANPVPDKSLTTDVHLWFLA